MSKIESTKSKSVSQKLKRVYPKAFAVDERLMQSIAIFEDKVNKLTFSVTLGSPEEIVGLLKDSTTKAQGPYKFALKLLEEFDSKPKKAIIKAENDIDLCLKKEDLRGFKKIKVGMSEMLGLWNLYDFPIYSKAEFIESVREVDLKTDPDNKVNQMNPELYKVYGQKYLM